MNRLLASIALALSLMAPAVSIAAVPETMSWQGLLTDAAGAPVPNGTYDLTFRLYDLALVPDPLWIETQTAVPVSGGIVSVVLGSVVPITLPFDAQYHLGVSVNGGAEMVPRVPLSSTPYSLSLRLPFAGAASSAGPALSIVNGGGGAAIVSSPLLEAQGALTVTGGASTTVFDGEAAGDGAAQLPGDAVSGAEILDEPGVASATSSTQSTVGNSIAPIISRSIVAPADGWVLVIATCEVSVYHNSGTADNAIFGVSGTASTLPANQQVAMSIASSMPSNFYTAPYSLHGLFPVSAGTNTFYLNAQRPPPVIGPYGGVPIVYDKQLTLAYFPTAYGTITPTLTSDASTELRATVPPLSAAEIAAEQREAEVFNSARAQRELSALRARLDALEARLPRAPR